MKAVALVYLTVLSGLPVLIFGDVNECKALTSTSAQYQLRSTLLPCSYDEYQLPEDVKIKTTLYLMKIEFADYKNHFVVGGWMLLVWTDQRLKWNPRNFEDTKITYLSTNEIWSPKIILLNPASSSDRTLNDAKCAVGSAGVVACVIPFKHKAFCNPDLTKWPHDTQDCTLRYTEYMLTQTNLTPTDPGILLLHQFKYSNWKMLSYKSDQVATYNGSISVIDYNFIVQRMGHGYGAMLYLPYVGLSLSTIVSLFYKFDSLERTVVICTNMMNHIISIQNLSWIMPKNSNMLPEILILYRNSIVFVLFILLETILLKKYIKQKLPLFVENGTKYFASTVGAKLLFIKTNTDTLLTDEVKPKDDIKWINVLALIIDRLTFVVLFFVYFIYIVAFVLC